MSEMDRREEVLRQDGYFIGIATFSLIAGMHFSPYFNTVATMFRPILFGFYITSPVIIFYLTSLLLSVGTVIVAGIPAAMFERATGRTQSDGTSLLIWLIATGVLAFPAFSRLIGVNL
jgi:hypothetical protein